MSEDPPDVEINKDLMNEHLLPLPEEHLQHVRERMKAYGDPVETDADKQNVAAQAKDLFNTVLSENRAQVAENKAESRSIDKLTKLPVGDALKEEANEKIQLVTKEQRRHYPNKVRVYSIDGYQLKLTNDQYGHEAGNILIKHMSEALVHAVRGGDIVGRVSDGGDEFVLVIPYNDEDISDEDLEIEIDDRIKSVTKEFKADGKIKGMRWCSVLVRDGEDFNQALHRADPVPSVNPGRIRAWPPEAATPRAA